LPWGEWAIRIWIPFKGIAFTCADELISVLKSVDLEAQVCIRGAAAGLATTYIVALRDQSRDQRVNCFAVRQDIRFEQQIMRSKVAFGMIKKAV
jgi:hypothetical protein